MGCNVVVLVGCELDPTIPLRIERASGRIEVNAGDERLRIAPAGRRAVQWALNLPGVQVAAVASGGGHEPALRHALAAGAQRAVEIVRSAAGEEPSLQALADWLRQSRAELFIGDRIAGHIAARLGWSHVAGLTQLACEGDRLRAVRQLDRGDSEEVLALLPAAVSMSEQAARPEYVVRARMQNVDVHRIERAIVGGQPRDNRISAGGWQQARPRSRVVPSAAPPTARGIDRLQALLGEPPAARSQPVEADRGAAEESLGNDALAERLIRFLAHHGLLARRSRDE